MRMEQIEIIERDGIILITQDDPLNDPSAILLSPEQVPLVCDELKMLAGKLKT